MTAINVRWHTEGRRQPTLIGKDASGRKIPGGPYIVWQLLAFPVAPLMWSTRSSWAGQLSGLATVVVVAATAGAVFFLIGRIDFGGRNPLFGAAAVTAALLLALTASTGRLGGVRVPGGRRPRTRTAHDANTWHTAASPATHWTAPVTAVPGHAAAPGAADQAPPTLSSSPATTTPTPTTAPAIPQPSRLSPLEAFMAAAGKVTT